MDRIETCDRIRRAGRDDQDTGVVEPFDAATTVAFAIRSRRRLGADERAAVAEALDRLPSPDAAAGALVAAWIGGRER